MADTVLCVASRAVVDACERLDLDIGSILNAAGVTREQLDDPDLRLPTARADALWRAAYEQAEDPFLALHAAEALPFGAYKVVDYLCAHSPTVGAAYTRIADFFRIVDDRARLEVTDGATPVLTMRSTTPGPLRAPAQEYTFAALIGRAHHCAGGAWSPLRVEFSSDAPDDTREHVRIMRAPVRFGCAEARIVFSLEAWSAPVASNEPLLLSVLEDHARRLLAELPAGEDLAARVRDAIAPSLPEGEVTASAVARRLAMSERTLQRRLREHGASFGQLLDDTRLRVAKAHLADPSLSLAEVAWLVGFADQSTFSRAFKRWSGKPPGAWRAQR